MDLFTYLMAKKGHNIVINDDMFAYLLGKAHGGGGQVKTASGITINIPDAKKLVSFMMTKESTQDGTPTPDNPVEVKTVKGYRNLLNKSIFTNTYINGSGVETTDTKNAAFDFIPAISNQAYTFNANSSLYRINIVEYDENQNFIQITFGRETNINTITTTATTKYIRATINYNNSAIVTSSVIDTLDLQIVEGTTTKPYVPYGNNYVDVKVIGKNLFDISNYYVRETRTNVEVNLTTGSLIATDDRNYANKMVWFNIPVENGTTYKINYENNTFTRIQYTFSEQSLSTWAEVNALTRTDVPSTRTITSSNTNLIIVLTMSNAVLEANIDNLMLEQGTTATTYEPYKETIVPIPLNNNEIVGIGDYKDELIVDKNGNVYLNKKTNKYSIVSENITKRSSYTNIDYAVIPKPSDYIGYNTYDTIPILCYSAEWIERAIGSWDDTRNIDKISGNAAATNWWLGFTKGTELSEMQSKLSNSYIYYPLVTPDLIDLQTTVDLTLFKGENTITNSEDGYMTIEYR